MILRLAVPYIDHDVSTVKVGDWHKREGERVNYGDPICDLYVDEVVIKRQFLEPDDTFRDDDMFHVILSGRADSVAERQWVANDFQYSVLVVSSDCGWMGRIFPRRSERREVGGLLALLTTEPKERVPPDAEHESGIPAFRTVTELAGSGEHSHEVEVEHTR